ncbi:MAG: sigma-70 family RNA polymerase sigma factor [Myxococcota bacterium]
MKMFISTRARRFRELYLCELDFVWTVLRRLGVPDAQVEDAAHDVFVVVHRRIDDFEARSSERTWLYGIARRVAWRYRRAEQRRTRRKGALAQQTPERLEPEGHEVVRRAEARRLLHAFLETLDAPKREAFVLGEIEGLPRASLAQALGVKPSTAYSRLRAARADFEEAFGPDGPAGPVVRRLASATERPPAQARQRLWLALPGFSLGGVMGGAAVGGVAAALTIVGVMAVVPSEPTSTPSVGEPRAARAKASSSSSSSAPAVAARVEPADVEERVPPILAVNAPVRPNSRPSPTRVRRGAANDEARDTAKAPATTTAAESPTVSEPSADALAREAVLLSRARTQMQAEQWPAAWESLSLHARSFPRGRLAAERRRSSVTVACKLGRQRDALTSARALLNTPRGHEHEAALRRTCIGEQLFSEPVVSSVAGGDQGE